MQNQPITFRTIVSISPNLKEEMLLAEVRIGKCSLMEVVGNGKTKQCPLSVARSSDGRQES